MARYKELKVGDTKPDGYEYKHRISGVWTKGMADGCVVDEMDYHTKEYRILVKEPEMNFKVGDLVKPVRMAKDTQLYHGASIKSWEANGSAVGEIINIEPDKHNDEHYCIRARNNGDGTTYNFREDELAIFHGVTIVQASPAPVSAPAHPDAAQFVVGMRVRPKAGTEYEYGSRYGEWAGYKGKETDGIGIVHCIESKSKIRVKYGKDDYKIWLFHPRELDIIVHEGMVGGIGIDYPSSITISLTKPEETMSALAAPETELEKTACEAAKQDAITIAINAKKAAYTSGMNDYIAKMSNLKQYQDAMTVIQKEIDALEKNLGITAEQKKQLF